MRVKAYLLVCAFFCLFMAPGTLFAQSHDGFFFRFLGGIGDGSFSAKYDGGSPEYESSSATVLGFRFGWSLNRHWILHYNITNLAASELTRAELGNAKYSMRSRGIGLSYYFLAENVYISPELRFSTEAELEVDNSVFRYSGGGFGFTIGKEWRFTSDWGLGLALSYHQDDLDGDNTRGSASTSHLGILFSATYN